MPRIIYSERYFLEDFCNSNSPMILNFKHNKAGRITEKDFIDKAVLISKREHISLEVLEADDRMSADFSSKSVLFSEESSALLEELLAESDFIEIVISRGPSPTARLRFGRLK